MAQDMFLKLTDIEAESKDKVYGKNIDVLAWSWGCSQSATMHMGGGGGGGKVSMQDVSCTKFIDKATPILFKHCCTGVHIPKGELIVRKAGGKQMDYFKINMEEIIISSYSTGGSGGEDRLTENFTMNFSKVSIKYVEQTQTGAEGDKPDYAYDMSENVETSAFEMG